MRESEKMAKKRDLLSLQAKNIQTQDCEGASLGCMLDNRKHQQGSYEAASPALLQALFHARGPRLDNGGAQSPGGFCKPV